MGRKSKHNIIRDNLWENTSSNILAKDTVHSIEELYYTVLAQETFGSSYIDDIYDEWNKIYSDIFNMLKELKAKLINNSTFKLPNISLKQPFTIEQDKTVNAYNKVKCSLTELREHFRPLNENTLIITFENIFKSLGDSVGFSVTSKKDIEKNFQENIIGNPLQYSIKDNLSLRASDDIVLCNLALILAFAHNKSIAFNILNEEFSEQLDNILKKNNAVLSEEDIKKMNTDNFTLTLDFIKKNITNYIPFSSEIKYKTIFVSHINVTYKRIHEPLTYCIKTLKDIRTLLDNDINYLKDTTLLKKISTLFFDLNIDKKSLENQCEIWTTMLNNLNDSKKQILVKYEELLPKIALENEYSETRFEDYELSMITNDILTSLQNNGKDLNRYYAFVSNFKQNNNFDKICFIIDSLASMKKEVSDSFIQIFMNKVHLKTEFKNIKTDVTSNDIKELVNRTHLSGSSLENLTNILFFDLSEEEWSFLFHLPLIEIEKKEWFEDFYSILKIYCK